MQCLYQAYFLVALDLVMRRFVYELNLFYITFLFQVQVLNTISALITHVNGVTLYVNILVPFFQKVLLLILEFSFLT